MEIKLLKKLFEEGVLKSAKIIPAPEELDKFLLVVVRASGVEERVSKARDKKDKVYRQVTGAILDAREVGFKEITLRFD